MRVSRQDFERAVSRIKAAGNYAGPDLEAMRSSGGDVEDHYIMRGGTKVRVATSDAVNGAYEIDDTIAAKVLPDRFL